MVMSPNALCFSQEFPASGTPCLVLVEGRGLTVTFISDAAQGQSKLVPFPSLSVTPGGFDHGHLMVKWTRAYGQRTLYPKNADLIRVFRQAVPDHLNDPLERAAERVREVRKRRRTVWSLAVLLGLGV